MINSDTIAVRPQVPHYNEQTAGFIKVLSWPNLPPYKISYITRLCFWQNLSTLLSSEVDVITPLKRVNVILSH